MAGNSANEARMSHVENEIKEQRKTVAEQGQVLAVLANSINKIEHYMEESIKIQKEQAVLFERFTNHEEQNSTEHRYLHQRMDKLSTRCDDIELNHKTTCDIVKPMAEKGASVHKGLLRVAWGTGSLIGGMLFLMVIWWIKTSNYGG